MGTKISKDAPSSNSNQSKIVTPKDMEQIDYKSRLEKKLCLVLLPLSEISHTLLFINSILFLSFILGKRNTRTNL